MGRVGSEQGEFMKKLNALKTGRRWQMKGALGSYVSVVASAARNPVSTIALTLTFLVGTLIAYGQYGRGVIFSLVRTSVHADTRQCSWQLFSGRDQSFVPRCREGRHGCEGSRQHECVEFSSSGSDQIGNIFMELLPENERSMTADDMIKNIRKDVDRFAGVSVEIMKMEQGPGRASL